MSPITSYEVHFGYLHLKCLVHLSGCTWPQAMDIQGHRKEVMEFPPYLCVLPLHRREGAVGGKVG